MEKIAQVNIGNTLFGGPHFLRSLTGVGRLVSVLLSNAMIIAGVVFTFLLVIAGINMVASAGNPQKVEQARNILSTAVVGFIVIVIAFFIVRIIEAVFGVTILG